MAEPPVNGQAVKIGERFVGRGHPVFVVAEAGINHNGDQALARRLVEVAATAEADAVKFQSFTAEGLISRRDPDFARIRSVELPREFHPELVKLAEELGITFLSSAFAVADVDFLDALGLPAFKIASCEVTNLPLLRYVAERGKPIFLSTGFATLGEIEEALEAMRLGGDPPVVLLHCVSQYPAPYGAMNLRVISTLREAFGVPVGLSDHTPGIYLPLAAVALGACVIEKHITLDRALPGVDHQASLEPGDLRSMVEGIRAVEQALGTSAKRLSSEEEALGRAMRKSLIAETRIESGSLIARTDLGIKRPGTGLPPKLLDLAVGKRARRTIESGELLSWGDIEW